ncbi:MAG TPA: ribonuclease Y [Deinococcales bacterium]|nr:ribonuclease Y [Deinococcales bacterium]
MEYVLLVIGLLVGLAIGYLVAQSNYRKALSTRAQADAGIREAATAEAETIRRQAIADADRVRGDAEVQARTRLLEAQTRIEEDSKRERDAIRVEREALRSEREEARVATDRLTKRAEQLAEEALKLDKRDERLKQEERRHSDLSQQYEEKLAEADRRLFEIGELSREAARDLILGRVDAELEEEKAVRIKMMMEKAHLEVKRRSQNIIAQAIQRSASETTAAMSVSVVPIPSDAMKGRIIGREGRNIRAFESLTGVDLIIDDTPEAVILSSFNPVRREVAVKALEQLVADGRIHPSRIEEVVQKAQDEMKSYIHDRGEEAAIEANVVGLKPGLLQLLGRMHFRSSYAQNVLKHSIQVAHLCGLMAAELGLDAQMARRAGLLHDIGKSIDRELEGTHVEIGITLAKRFGEPHEVIDAIAHHHDPENGETVYSVLAAAADAMSAARPGARRESLEVYIKRLEQLENIAVSFPGVETAYAIQAGREVRIIVQPEKVSDSKAAMLAREIAGRIEQDMEYPGQVQVTVVRESRSIEYAR